MRYDKNYIDPKNVLIDDRSFTDLLNFVSNYSKNLKYFNNNNQPLGSFFEMFSSDESFLIAEISKYDINKFLNTRNDLIRQFDLAYSLDEKSKVLNSYIETTYELYFLLNNWFFRAFSKNLELPTSSLQIEIESIILDKASTLLNDFKEILTYVEEINFENIRSDYSFNSFISSSWNIVDKIKVNSLKEYSDLKKNEILFKKVVLNGNAIFKIVKSFVQRCERKLENSLNKSNHNPHIGLLFSFIKLFKHLQNDINKLTKSHLDFYYKDILEIKKNISKPNNTYAVLGIDENINEVVIDKGERIVAGQYDDGQDILYKTKDDVFLNNAKISHLMSIYVSKNPLFEYNSRYNLISSIFTKTIASTTTEIQNFNLNNNTFNALGIDLDHESNHKSSIEVADIGFAIGSPVFRLGKSKRIIKIDFELDNKSMKLISELIIDISNKTDLNDNEVFDKVFLNSFNVFYTSNEDWKKIEDFQIIMPDDWSKKTLTFSIEIDKTYPACVNYDSDLHGDIYSANTPVFKFIVNQNSFYNPYAFLNKVNVTSVKIKCLVNDLREFKFFRDSEEIPISSEFEIFGPTPKLNSNCYIACEELFNKNISDLKIKLNFSNLDEVNYDLGNYYNSYNSAINNNSFKIKTEFLSDFNYFQINKSDDFMFNIEDGKIISSKILHYKDILKSKLSPDYNLKSGQIIEFSNDYETGFIKLSLTSPSCGFGSNLYSKLYSDSFSSENNSNDLNEPFIPKIDNLSIDYACESKIYFTQENRSKNNFNENNSFFQISPLGIKRTFSEELIQSSLFYDLKNEGELIIGFESDHKIKNIDLFFEIVKNQNENYDFRNNIRWYYSTTSDWKPLNESNLLSDGTNSLLNSGIISFVLPDDFSNESYILNKFKFYIKATSKNKVDQLGMIKSIYSNACEIEEVIPENTELRIEKLKKNSLQNFEKNINGLNTIIQPIDSNKIKLFEDDIEYYKRVSQILKHKNRPVTKNDIESFILNNFDFISYVKCIDNSNNILQILCLKKIQSHQNIDEIILSNSEKITINNFLKKYISPHFQVQIVNPLFEDLWIKCHVKFLNVHAGRGVKRLNNDIFNFICPWKNLSFINEINCNIKHLTLFNFIKELDYVSHVTGFSIIHILRKDENSMSIFDSASNDSIQDFIKCGSPRSILIPRYNNKISIIDDFQHVESSPIKLEDLEIDKSFIIKKTDHESETIHTEKNKDNLNNLQLIIK